MRQTTQTTQPTRRAPRPRHSPQGLSVAVHHTPIGPLTLVTGEQGLRRVIFGDVAFAGGSLRAAMPPTGSARASSEVGVPDAVARSGPDGAGSDRPPATAAGLLGQARRELDGYFAGRLREFTVPVDLRLASPFHRTVLGRLVEVAPYGVTTTYGALAASLGLPLTAARSVGRAMALNPVAIVVPCHRVVGADGSLTGYGGGIEVKRRLLQMEGSLQHPQLDFTP
jgi:methylated-DNA-[protein]-cysteine S-methyltransferase